MNDKTVIKTARVAVHKPDHQILKDIKHLMETETGKCIPMADIFGDALRLYVASRATGKDTQ